MASGHILSFVIPWWFIHLYILMAQFLLSCRCFATSHTKVYYIVEEGFLRFVVFLKWMPCTGRPPPLMEGDRPLFYYGHVCYLPGWVSVTRIWNKHFICGILFGVVLCKRNLYETSIVPRYYGREFWISHVRYHSFILLVKMVVMVPLVCGLGKS